MDAFTILAKVLEQALIAWNYGQKYKFIKRLAKIQLAYEVEFDKPTWRDREDYPESKAKHFRDYVLLGKYERELQHLGQEYLTAVTDPTKVRNI